jgi:hypothetical protein
MVLSLNRYTLLALGSGIHGQSFTRPQNRPITGWRLGFNASNGYAPTNPSRPYQIARLGAFHLPRIRDRAGVPKPMLVSSSEHPDPATSGPINHVAECKIMWTTRRSTGKELIMEDGCRSFIHDPRRPRQRYANGEKLPLLRWSIVSNRPHAF